MKNAFLKIRISDDEKNQLDAFATESGRSISEVVRDAVTETVSGQVAGKQRREAIASLRRSINLLLEVFSGKPVDVAKLRSVAAKVRQEASKVLV